MPGAQPKPQAGGCSRPDFNSAVAIQQLTSTQATKPQVFLTSGDNRIDAAFGALTADIAGRFGVRPFFAFYDDSGSPNAKAVDISVVPGTAGLVLAGKSMMLDRLNRPGFGDLFVMSVCAHEFGHILQYKTRFYGRLSTGQGNHKNIELHADFLAGYYLAARGDDYQPRRMIDLGQAWETLGSSDYSNPDFHGTATERIAAIEEGFKVGRQRPQFGVLDMCEVGARFLGA